MQRFIPTRSKAKALRLSGFPHPLAVKVNGGFVVYNAY